MKITGICLFGGALLGAGLVHNAAADVSIDGVLFQFSSDIGYDFGSLGYSLGPTSVDTFAFSVLSDGMVTFDMLSYQIFNTWIDPMLFVFTDDGNPLGSANLIDSNDDSLDSDLNGSTFLFDSFIEVFLTSGDYFVTVAPFFTDIGEIDSGIAANGTVYDVGGNGVPTSGQYHLDIFGDVVIPTPGALALLGLGGLTATRRRR